MPINIAAIADSLKPGVYEMAGNYPRFETQWSKVFDTHKSDMAFERKVQNRLLPLPQFMGEGQAVFTDNLAGQRKVYNAESFTVGLAYAWTRRALEDNLYKSEISPTTMNMMEQFKQFKEIVSFNILNNATVYDATIGGDGQPLCSTAHPVDGGTFANRPTVDADLNEASLLNGMLAIPQQFVDEANTRINIEAEMLIVPLSLWPVAQRLVSADLRPGTSNNDPNVIGRVAGGLKKGILASPWLSSNFAWFLKTNRKGLVMLERRGFEMDMHVDFLTDNLLVKGTERYTPTYNDERAIYASLPTS